MVRGKSLICLSKIIQGNSKADCCAVHGSYMRSGVVLGQMRERSSGKHDDETLCMCKKAFKSLLGTCIDGSKLAQGSTC